jgi:hypothetical protein
LKVIKSTDENLKKKLFKRLEDQQAQYPIAQVLIQLRSKLDPETLTLESLENQIKARYV